MSRCWSLDFGLGNRREVCAFGSDDPSRNIGMMGHQVFFQEVSGVAFSGGVTDEDDLFRGGEIFRDILIERIFFRYALAAVVRLRARRPGSSRFRSPEPARPTAPPPARPAPRSCAPHAVR